MKLASSIAITLRLAGSLAHAKSPDFDTAIGTVDFLGAKD